MAPESTISQPHGCGSYELDLPTEASHTHYPLTMAAGCLAGFFHHLPSEYEGALQSELLLNRYTDALPVSGRSVEPGSHVGRLPASPSQGQTAGVHSSWSDRTLLVSVARRWPAEHARMCWPVAGHAAAPQPP